MRRRPCDLAVQSPCARASYRRVPVLFRRGAPRGGSSSAPADPYLYGLSNFSASSRMQSAAGGGEAGVGTGFGEFVQTKLTALSFPNSQMLAANATTGGSKGYQLYISTTGVLTAAISNAAGTAYVNGPTHQFVASDVGQVFTACIYLDGANVVRLWVSRAEKAAGTATTGYTADPTPASQSMGALSSLFPATACTICASATFRGNPSKAQFEAYYDAARALGDLPDTIGGATVTHLWSLKRELAGVVSPAGRKTYGARGFVTAGTTGITSAAGAGLQGAAAGFTAFVLVKFDKLPSTNETVACATNSPQSTGWMLNASGAALRFVICPSTISANYTLTAADLGRWLVIACTYTGTAARLTVHRAVAGSDVTGAYVVNSGQQTIIGYAPPASTPASSVSVSAVMGGNIVGGASNAQVTAVVDAFEATGSLVSFTGMQHLWDFGADIVTNSNAMPATFADRIGSDTMTRGGTLEVALVTEAVPFCPAQLTDRVTAASGDALARVGQPTVVKIDPTIDGRRGLGAQGFSASNCLQTAPGLGIQGTATGFRVSVRMRWDAVPTGNQVLVHCLNAGGSASWFIRTLGAIITASVNGTTAGYTVTAADVGRTMLVAFVFTGSAVRLCINGVQIGADVAATYSAATSTAMQVGSWAGGPWVLTSGSVFDVSGGNYVPTLAELAQEYADSETFGTLQPIPGAGKTPHLWNLTTDILASGVDAVPATVLDRVGTDNLTRVGPDYAIAGKQGLRLLGAGAVITNGLQTAPGGGIRGASAALTISMLWTPISNLLGANEVFASAFLNGAAPGWFFNRAGTVGTLGALNVVLSATGGNAQSGSYAIQAGDLGAIMHVAVTYDGANLRFSVNGVLVSTVAFTQPWVAPAVAMQMGTRSDGNPSNNNNAFFAIGGGAYVATQAELLAQATESIAAGQLVAIPGKTDDRRYNFGQDAIDQGTTLPSKCVDRMGNADPLVRVGSGLTLAQRTERLFSYETKPLFESLNGLTASDFYSAPGGFAGDPAAFGFVWVGTIDSQSVASATRVLVSKGDAGFPGYQLATIATNSAFQFQAGSATTKASTSTSGIAAGELGKLFVVGCWYDGAKVHMAVRRVEIGSGTALTGAYAASAAAFTVGKRSDSLPADGTSFRGFIGMSGAPSIAEFQAIHDAILARESIVDPTGRASVLYDATKDAIAAGNAVPATITDRVGSAPLAKQGAPTLSLGYARAAA